MRNDCRRRTKWHLKYIDNSSLPLHIFCTYWLAAAFLGSRMLAEGDTQSFKLANASSLARVYGDADGVVMPPGCSCVRSGVLESQCDLFECTCLCNLNAGSCDLDCCCDPECTEEEVARFPYCKEDGSVDPILKMCYESHSALEDINPSYPMRVSDSPEVGFIRFFCSRPLTC